MEQVRKLPTILLSSGAGLFVLFLALPLLRGTVYTEDDLGAFHLPLRAFYQQCLIHGDSFLWTPYIFNGFYLLGEGQLGTLHPLHWALYRFLPLEAAFTLELWMAFPFALAGMFLFLRRWNLHTTGAVFGAFCFALLGFNLNHYVHMHFVTTLAHLPWAWYAINCLLRPRARQRRIAAPLLFVFLLSLSQLLKAMPQAILFSWIAEGSYVLFILLSSLRAKSPDSMRLLLVSSLLLLVKILAIGVAGAQLIPLWEGLQSSSRANPGDDFRLSISLHPWNLAQFFNPYLFQRRVYAPFSGDEPWDAIYFGAAAPALLVLLALRWRSLGSARALAVFGGGLAAFGLLAALGRYGFVHYALDWIPIIDKLRAPARYVALFHAGLALVLGIGVAALFAKNANPRNTGLLVLPALVALLTLLVPSFIPEKHLAMPFTSTAIGAGLVCVGSVLVWACARGRRFAPVLLVLFVLFDTGLYGLRHKPSQALDAYLAEIPRPPTQPGARIDTDIHPTYLNRYGMLGYRVVYGYTALMPDRALDYTQEVPLRVAGVEWREARHAASPELAAAKERGEMWVPIPGPMPRIRLVPDPDSMQMLFGDVQVIEESPGAIQLQVHAPEYAWLFVGESIHPGWRASIDGMPTKIIPAHQDFMAVPVGGTQHVEFRFEPESFTRGKTITLASFGISGLFFLLLLYSDWRGRRA